MRVVITGAAGFLGRLLTARLVQAGRLAGPDGSAQPVDALTLVDAGPLQIPASVAGTTPPVDVRQVDVTDAAAVVDLLAGDEPLTVFHLAAMVSGACERDPDGAWAVNVEGTRNVLEAARHRAGPTRLVATSSVAVYGHGAAGTVVDDDTRQVPATTYGMTKAAGELMVDDATRKGFLDGRTARLPTVVVRPGAANAAASSFASAIVREPAAGRPYVLPVPWDTPIAAIGYREVVDGLVALHDLHGDVLGPDRALALPGVTVTPRDLYDALVRHVGTRSLADVTLYVDPVVRRIADGWPAAVTGTRARDLGFAPSGGADTLVAAYLADFG